MDKTAKGIFITGTDTDAGKTVVSASLLCILRGGGIDAVPMKPVQTGCIETRQDRFAPDLDFCIAAAELNPSREEYSLMCPFRLKDPCSPHLAAARENIEISFETIVHCFNTLAARHDFVIVEGAGGVMVPVCSEMTMLDLMRELSLPVILSARPGLGTINHALLSLHRLRQTGLTVKGIIFNNTASAEWGYIEDDNLKIIEKLGGTPVLGTIPFLPDIAEPQTFGLKLTEKHILENMPSAGQLTGQTPDT